MISIGDLFTFVKKYKNIVATSVLIIALLVGAVYVKSWYDDKLTEQYNSGVTATDRKWEDVMNKNREERSRFLLNQQAKTDALAEELAEERLKNKALQEDNASRQQKYANSDKGKAPGLDDDFVDIYNESLGVLK